MTDKFCSKCGTTKPVSKFGKRTSAKDGLNCWCKTCRNAANADYQKANPEKVKAAKAAWEKANPEKVNASAARWAAANPEKRAAARLARYAANPAKHKASNAKWRASNADKERARCANWAASNPEAKRFHRANRRARNIGKLSPGLLDRLFELQRGKCACGCKQPLGDDYHLDHRMPLALGGMNTDDNMQLLRKLCNLQKGAKHPVAFMQQRGFLL